MPSHLTEVLVRQAKARLVVQLEVRTFALGLGREAHAGHASARAAHPGIPWSRETTLEDSKWTETTLEAVLEQLIEHGPDGIASVFARAFELAMQIERERFLGAGFYERTPDRRGYANGYQPKRIDTPAGTVSAQTPKTAGHDGEPFDISSRWSAGAVLCARSCWRWRKWTSRAFPPARPRP